MALSDAPIRLHNSVQRTDYPTGTIHAYVTAREQWDLVRWLKARTGQFIADLYGPIWVDGGRVLWYGDGTSQVKVEQCRAWPLFRRSPAELYSWPVLTPEQVISLPSANHVLVAVAHGASADKGRVIAVELEEGSAQKEFNYLSMTEAASRAVPLALISFPGQSNATLVDLRMPAMGAYVYREVFYEPDFGQTVGDPNGYYAAGLQVNRALILAEPISPPGDGLFGASKEARLLVPMRQGDALRVQITGYFWFSESYPGVGNIDPEEFELTLMVNGEPLNTSRPGRIGVNPGEPQTYTIRRSQRSAEIPGPLGNAYKSLRGGGPTYEFYFVSRVNAIHDIRVGISTPNLDPFDKNQQLQIVNQFDMVAFKVPRALQETQ